ncbi:MAG TPA: ArsR family transcriptional regulator [Candidatus Omnitrophica bacterium]|nr:MAG: hypothetical protein A2Z92_04930 [Omnitrophica WOR_2 bacterium GWA2_63_20]OGX16185.1 MAG: hypothetical protein A2105_06155 [Omnitrophica WOR_2 bacterium GWF2_63_9]OGX32930.1 MAG: hypothetical protein A3E56_00720 [Omnitrophica WOR_2 bacterium RIFCSPHIGHO2_12_FULL_64_13]OGX35164.1 MAG: hypothetical protein A3B73_02350 [Omnitrophica WOR_2 bacterium RIFCSPHIGHO2_02_FULL_63_39]OGX45552.1 MAG: hypothetical protein A3I71_01665 [Omnitrophica WOR_2 bacterium RIFCSPLOWO2_02_FULL_63_16]OGX48434.1
MAPNALLQSNRLFKAFADPTRLRILNLLRARQLCVCELIAVLKLPQSTVSRHLAYLKRAGLVDSWEEGARANYRLAKPGGKLHQALLGCVGTCLGDEVGQFKVDRQALLEKAIRC